MNTCLRRAKKNGVEASVTGRRHKHVSRLQAGSQHVYKLPESLWALSRPQGSEEKLHAVLGEIGAGKLDLTGTSFLYLGLFD
eukprot:1381335-Amorphochlora_amoeboformis.AAC.1